MTFLTYGYFGESHCRVQFSSVPSAVAAPTGVARSIESDVDNLMRLIRIANILPKGLYVESAVKVGGADKQQTSPPPGGSSMR